jgi:tetratricopeptide (TPR) repeat protein
MAGLNPLLKREMTQLALAAIGLTYLPGFQFSPVVCLAQTSSENSSDVEELESDDTAAVDAGGSSAEELIQEAEALFRQDHPIDARAKLQKAIKLAPGDFRPHLMLGAYYLTEVGHFRLAFRYISTAEKLFEKKYGSDLDDTLDNSHWREHARILYLLSESYLNLDDYAGSLKVLDRFEKRYWDTWYPGTRAWVLMKLKKVDEAIRVAQAGLIRGAEPARTYNILGILLSLKGNRNLSLEAFGRAIQVESALGGLGQVATPLNNAGEVYREQCRDDLAEAAWLKAVKLPDGCDHILPSLNLSILLLDQLRMLQSDRVLNDFEACYAQHSQRQDSEHRALIALGRGRIALHSGDIWSATDLLQRANERQQWFGKIGTNENDLRIAATIAWADALEAQAAALTDRSSPRLIERLALKGIVYTLRGRVAWFRERARKIGLNELVDFEDLYFRNTDSMIQYPTLGRVLAALPTKSLEARFERIKIKDKRSDSALQYNLYIAQNYLAHGRNEDAIKLLHQVNSELRPIDRLARAEALITLIKALENKDSWWSPLSSKEQDEVIRLKEQLFDLNAPALRTADLSLPVVLTLAGDTREERKIAKQIASEISTRFVAGDSKSLKYVLKITVSAGSNNSGLYAEASISRRASEQTVVKIGQRIRGDGDISAIANNLIAKAFRHKVDPAGAPASESELLGGMLIDGSTGN